MANACIRAYFPVPGLPTPALERITDVVPFSVRRNTQASRSSTAPIGDDATCHVELKVTGESLTVVFHFELTQCQSAGIGGIAKRQAAFRTIQLNRPDRTLDVDILIEAQQFPLIELRHLETIGGSFIEALVDDIEHGVDQFGKSRRRRHFAIVELAL